MTLDAEVLHNLTKGSVADAWRVIIDKAGVRPAGDQRR
jgi:hypothetical protein